MTTSVFWIYVCAVSLILAVSFARWAVRVKAYYFPRGRG